MDFKLFQDHFQIDDRTRELIFAEITSEREPIVDEIWARMDELTKVTMSSPSFPDARSPDYRRLLELIVSLPDDVMSFYEPETFALFVGSIVSDYNINIREKLSCYSSTEDDITWDDLLKKLQTMLD